MLARCLALLMAVCPCTLAAERPPAPPSELTDYVRKPDNSYSWKLKGKIDTPAGTVFELTLTSQTWHDIKWEHDLQVFLPKDVKPQVTMVLYNTGGGSSPASGFLGLTLAQKIKAPVAFLYHVPAQPLFGGKKEDALIAETFVRYLDSKDGTWPLLFPMVKSVVRAMDAVQAFATAEWKTDVKKFVITGASKRGWTTWLTAATQDPRVKAIAPLVIDTLNMPMQMKNQVQAFGKPSQMIHDYTERNLVPIPDTPESKKLWSMIDPWVYRERLNVPKLLVNGTNDPYWPLDAMNSYWDDLPGEKCVLYVPNAGHDLRETSENGVKQSLPTRAVNTLAAFSRCQIFDTPLPTLKWKYGATETRLTLNVEPKGSYRTIRFWQTTSPTRDFRSARWQEGSRAVSGIGPEPATVGGISTVADPNRYTAIFAEAEYELDGLKFTSSTQIRILEPKK